MIIVPVILAGGIGERFWPFSRSSMPKQLLPIISKRSMIEETYVRVKPFCDKKIRPLIITSKAIAGKIQNVLPKTMKYDVIKEPVGKNTAPAVALGAMWIRKMYGDDAIMVVVSADHAIYPQQEYAAAVYAAAEIAQKRDALVVFGIKPSRPDTGYGYIQKGKEADSINEIRNFSVKRFVEKPTTEKAQRYTASGAYLWNSGMFVWKTEIILKEFQQYMPQVYANADAAGKQGFTQKTIDTFYVRSEKESIDYGIMEKSKHVAVVEATFQWDDIGSWESLSRIHPCDTNNTTVYGKRIYQSDCSNTIVANQSDRVVAAIGLKDTVVITVNDAVLVIAKEKLPAFKSYISHMKNDPQFPQKLF